MPAPSEGPKTLTLRRGPEIVGFPTYIPGPIYFSGKNAVRYETGGRMVVLGEVIARGPPSKRGEFEGRQKANPSELSIGRFYGAPTGAIKATRPGRMEEDLGPVTELVLVKMSGPPPAPKLMAQLDDVTRPMEIAKKTDVRAAPATLMANIIGAMEIIDSLNIGLGGNGRLGYQDYFSHASVAKNAYDVIITWAYIDERSGRTPEVGREEMKTLKLVDMKLRGAMVLEAVERIYGGIIPSDSKLLAPIRDNFKILWETENLATASAAIQKIEAAFRKIDSTVTPPGSIAGLEVGPGLIIERARRLLGEPSK